jgi:hypothetical protein
MRKAQEMFLETKPILQSISTSQKSFATPKVAASCQKDKNHMKTSDQIKYYNKQLNASLNNNPIQFYENATDFKHKPNLQVSKEYQTNLKQTNLSVASTDENPNLRSSSDKKQMFLNSSDVINIKNEAAKNSDALNDETNSIKSNSTTNSLKNKTQLSDIQFINRSLVDYFERTSKSQATASSKSSSNLKQLPSLVTKNDSIDKQTHELYDQIKLLNREIDLLKKSNEQHEAKVTDLRFDLKSKDSTIDSLKLKIAQLYVDVETMKLNNRNLESDKTLLISEINALSGEKNRYYNELVKLNNAKDLLQKEFDRTKIILAEQGKLIL